MKPILTAAVAALCMALSGCATGLDGMMEDRAGVSQNVFITTPPTTGATCTLTSGTHSSTIVSPNVARILYSKESVHILCKKPGWQDGAAIMSADFDINSMGTGFNTDATTGRVVTAAHMFPIPMIQEKKN